MKIESGWGFIRLKQKVAEIIGAGREKTGLSQDKFALIVGVSIRFYQGIESRARQASLERIFKLCDGLECHDSVIF